MVNKLSKCAIIASNASTSLKADPRKKFRLGSLNSFQLFRSRLLNLSFLGIFVFFLTNTGMSYVPVSIYFEIDTNVKHSIDFNSTNYYLHYTFINTGSKVIEQI